MNYSKFLLGGAVAFTLALSTLATVKGQDVWYDNAITKPIEQVQKYVGKEDKVKIKYQQFLAEDLKFLEQNGVPKDILDTRVILKHNTLIDKALYPLMKVGNFLFPTSEEEQMVSQKKYEGSYSVYYSLKKNGETIQEYVMLGVNSFDDKNSTIYKDFSHILENKQQITSFVFFHEMGHKISHTIMNQKNAMNKIFETFEKEKGIKLSIEDKQIIEQQYTETFADAFAIAMTTKKYPNLDFEKTKELLSGSRLLDGDPTHLTSPGVISMKKIEPSHTLDDILKIAQESALITTQYYSPIDFSLMNGKIPQAENRDAPVKLIDLDADTVRKKMLLARQTFSDLKNNGSTPKP